MAHRLFRMPVLAAFRSFSESVAARQSAAAHKALEGLWAAGQRHKGKIGATAMAGALYFSPWMFSWDVVTVFERGGMPGWDARLKRDSYLERPDVGAAVENMLFGPDYDNTFAVIVGEHGTGKSTAIQRAVQKKCQAKGAVGVVHYKVPEQPSQFSLGLAAALGQRLDSFSEEGAVKRFYRKLTGKQETFESNKTWARLRDCLLAGARAFREKHGRPAVLVIDGVEVLATYEHWHFLEGLQKFAELAAADDSLIIVFVVGNSKALAYLKGLPSSSRMGLELEIGDVSDDEAVSYVMSRLARREGASDEEKQAVRQQAERAVKEITGGRFALLNVYNKAGCMNLEAWRERLYTKLKEAMSKAGVPVTHPIFKRLVEKGACTLDDLCELGLSWEKREALLSANILAKHQSCRYTFHSRYMRTFFEQQLQQQEQQQQQQ